VYARLRDLFWRQRRQPEWFQPTILRDAASDYVPIPITERLVQCLWYDQRLTSGGLRTTDGRPVRVLFQGWWNLEAGPDFHHATIQVGDEPEQCGDIEVHLRAEDWFHHGHQQDPLYSRVLLHVVLWNSATARSPVGSRGRPIPQVALESQLAAPLEMLYDEIDIDSYPYHVADRGGRCAALLGGVEAAVVRNLLDEAGEERFTQKCRRFRRWTHRVGPDQAFYEAWMEALGYKANKRPFRLLAQRLPLAALANQRAALPALLFGVASFLPVSLPAGRATASRRYIRSLWSRWWKLRPEFADRVLPEKAWRRHGVRPTNHPHRRLAAAALLLQRHRDLLGKTLGALEAGRDPTAPFTGLRDEFWAHHYTLEGRRHPAATELIGPDRARELAANVLLPFAAALARDRRQERLEVRARAAYRALPAAADHVIVKRAAVQLFGSPSAGRPFLRTARAQQGLIQIFQDFCLHDKSACDRCGFPELLRTVSGQPGTDPGGVLR